MNKNVKKSLVTLILLVIAGRMIHSKNYLLELSDYLINSFGETISLILILSCVAVVILVMIIWGQRGKFNYSKNIDMELYERFEQIYPNIKICYDCNVHAARKKWLKKYLLIMMFFVVMVGGSVIWRIDIKKILCILTIIFIIGLYLELKSIKQDVDSLGKKSTKINYKSLYKKEIICGFARSINSTLQYKDDVEEPIREKYEEVDFDERKMFKDLFFGHDYMIGEMGENAIITLADIHTSESNSENSRTIFKGVFARLKCENNIQNEIRILRNTFFKDKIGRIYFDNKDFEKIFDVYTLNEYEAKAILDTYLVNRLTEIYIKYGVRFEIVIKPNNIYLRIFTNELFNPGINPMAKKRLFRYYCAIQQAIELIDEVKNAITNAGM